MPWHNSSQTLSDVRCTIQRKRSPALDEPLNLDGSQDDCQQQDPPSPGSSTTSSSDALLVHQIWWDRCKVPWHRLGCFLQIICHSASSRSHSNCQVCSRLVADSQMSPSEIQQHTPATVCNASSTCGRQPALPCVSPPITENASRQSLGGFGKLQHSSKGDLALHDLLKSAMLQSALQDNCTPHWRTIDASMRHLIAQQSCTGWHHVPQGRISKSAVQHQESCCHNQLPAVMTTGQQWAGKLLATIWRTVPKMWKNRCMSAHGRDLTERQQWAQNHDSNGRRTTARDACRHVVPFCQTCLHKTGQLVRENAWQEPTADGNMAFDGPVLDATNVPRAVGSEMSTDKGHLRVLQTPFLQHPSPRDTEQEDEECRHPVFLPAINAQWMMPQPTNALDHHSLLSPPAHLAQVTSNAISLRTCSAISAKNFSSCHKQSMRFQWQLQFNLHSTLQ